jgi:hypothetical protein
MTGGDPMFIEHTNDRIGWTSRQEDTLRLQSPMLYLLPSGAIDRRREIVSALARASVEGRRRAALAVCPKGRML